jgi:hypothetical protein
MLAPGTTGWLIGDHVPNLFCGEGWPTFIDQKAVRFAWASKASSTSLITVARVQAMRGAPHPARTTDDHVPGNIALIDVSAKANLLGDGDLALVADRRGQDIDVASR